MGGSCSSRVAPVDPSTLTFATTHLTIEKSLRSDWEDQRRVIKCLLLGTGECGKSTILKQMRILHGRGFDSEEEVEMYRMLVLRNTMDSVGALCSAVIALGLQWEDDAQQRMAEQVLTFVEAFLSSPSTAAATTEADNAAAMVVESAAAAAATAVETRAKSSSISPRHPRLLPPLPPANSAVPQDASNASPTLPPLPSFSSVSSDASADHSSSSSSYSSSVAAASPSPPVPCPPPTCAAPAASSASNLSGLIPAYIQSSVVTLYASTAIQRALLRQNEFHLLDSAPYFLSAASRILHPLYTPTTADILRSRLPTTGIIESTFRMDRLTFRLYDVGGQRGERKKWIHCFEGVTAILFIAALSEFDQVLAEDRTRNRMKESLDLFHGITNLPWFRAIPVILFLNKADLFSKKVCEVDMGAYFPTYTGGCDYDNGLRYIQDQYLNRNENPDKSVYCHVTDATNTENIAFVWRAAKHIILEQSLNRSGMLF